MAEQLVIPDGFLGGGCLPRESELGAMFAIAGDALLTKYPRNVWAAYARKNRTAGRYIRHVYDQGSNGSCCPSMWCGGWYCSAAMHYGPDNLPPDGLSCMPMYKLLVRSPSQGVALDTCARHFQTVGTLPLDTRDNRQWMGEHGLNPDHVAPESNWNWREPSGTAETKKHFRLAELEDCRDYDDVMAGCLDGLPVGIGYSGHAVLIIDASTEVPTALDFLNTWNRWGWPLDPDARFVQYGRGRVTERELGHQIRNYGAFRIIRVHESNIFN